jgi:hypothetical protein
MAAKPLVSNFRPRKPRTKNRVVRIHDNGEYIDVQYVRDDGEVVIGMFQRFGWVKAPQSIVDDVNERLRRPVETVVLLGRPQTPK